MRKHNQQPIRQPRGNADDQSFTFRRSRTITGSAATNVRAAGEERGQLRSPRLHEHSLKKHRRKLSAYLSIILIASGGLWYVIASYIGETIDVTTSSAQPTTRSLDAHRYQEFANRYFSQRPFERFEFALNEVEFSDYMRSTAPELLEASITRGESLGSGQLQLHLREPVASWTIKNKQYFVDTHGVAFTVNYFSVPSVVVSDKSGINADAGVVASTKLLRFIGRIVTIINQAGLTPVEAVSLPAGSTREVDFKLQDKDYIIKTHLERDPAGQALDIVNAIKYIESKGISPQYLDVRVSSKAYYKDS